MLQSPKYRPIPLLIIVVGIIALGLVFWPVKKEGGETADIQPVTTESTADLPDDTATHDGMVEPVKIIDAQGKTVLALNVEIAETPMQWQAGLMHRTELAENSGMLFLFDEPAEKSFWMKDTPLSLDIIYIDTQGKIVKMFERTTPLSQEPLPSGGPIIAALEVIAGTVAKNGIRTGDRVDYSAFMDGDDTTDEEQE
jgi:uncharacterized protein